MSDEPREAQPPRLRLGGMALGNGLLVHGPTHWAAAVRRADGEIAIASGRKPRLRALDRLPGARGVVRLAEAMVVIPLVKRSLPAARLPFATPQVALTATAAAGAAAALRRRTHGAAGGELAAALVSMAPAVAALRGGELAAYHGVEHKAIGAYEHGEQDAAGATKEHERCGSHLLAPMLTLNLVGTLALRRTRLRSSQWASGAVALGSAGAAMELLAWAERHGDSAVAQLLRRPGYELQRVLGTREPDERQLEVGRAALAEILRAEGTRAAPAETVPADGAD